LCCDGAGRGHSEGETSRQPAGCRRYQLVWRASCFAGWPRGKLSDLDSAIRRLCSRRLRGMRRSSRGHLPRGGHRVVPGKNSSTYRTRSVLQSVRTGRNGLWSWLPWGDFSAMGGGGERSVGNVERGLEAIKLELAASWLCFGFSGLRCI